MPRKSQTKSIEKNEALMMLCEWDRCSDAHSSMDELMKHVEQHLLQLDISQEGGCQVCKWHDCGHENLGNMELVRHVFFHVFHAKIKCYGQNLIQKNQWASCMLDTSSHNTIPELPVEFHCCWDYCESVFDNPNTFYEHVKYHADYYPEGNNPEGGCRCLWDGCELIQKSKHKVRIHLRSHTQEKVVACPTCGSLFSSATRFSDHLKRQQDSDIAENNFQCSYCNKKFATERILKDHMRHHVNHYKCPYCEMTCPSPSNLKMHIDYKHNNAKQHLCPEEDCDYRGKVANDVRRHMERMHIKSTLKCEVMDCDFSCRSVGEYKIHYKTAHEGPSFQRYMCHVCGDKYSRGTRLTTHLKKKHRFRWLPGHNRFRFKLHDDGFYRLQTVRYESVDGPPDGAVQQEDGVEGSPEGVEQEYGSESPAITEEEAMGQEFTNMEERISVADAMAMEDAAEEERRLARDDTSTPSPVDDEGCGARDDTFIPSPVEEECRVTKDDTFIPSPTDKHLVNDNPVETWQSNDVPVETVSKQDMSYNLEMLGDVALNMFDKKKSSIGFVQQADVFTYYDQQNEMVIGENERVISGLDPINPVPVTYITTVTDINCVTDIPQSEFITDAVMSEHNGVITSINPVYTEMEVDTGAAPSGEVDKQYTVLTPAECSVLTGGCDTVPAGCSVVTSGCDSEVIMAETLEQQTLVTNCGIPEGLAYTGDYVRTSSPVAHEANVWHDLQYDPNVSHDPSTWHDPSIPQNSNGVMTSLVDSTGRMVHVTSNIPLTFANAVTVDNPSATNR